MVVSTKKRNSGRKASSNKKTARHYERTVVEPAARLIAAMIQKRGSAKTVTHQI